MRWSPLSSPASSMLSSGVAPGAGRDDRRGAERERHLFDGRPRFTPEGKTYHVESGDGSAGRGNGVSTNVASRIFASWNQIADWRRRLERLKDAA
jgi:hypothetical protein